MKKEYSTKLFNGKFSYRVDIEFVGAKSMKNLWGITSTYVQRFKNDIDQLNIYCEIVYYTQIHTEIMDIRKLLNFSDDMYDVILKHPSCYIKKYTLPPSADDKQNTIKNYAKKLGWKSSSDMNDFLNGPEIITCSFFSNEPILNRLKTHFKGNNRITFIASYSPKNANHKKTLEDNDYQIDIREKPYHGKYYYRLENKCSTTSVKWSLDYEGNYAILSEIENMDGVKVYDAHMQTIKFYCETKEQVIKLKLMYSDFLQPFVKKVVLIDDL